MGHSLYTRTYVVATYYIHIFNVISFFIALALGGFCIYLLEEHPTIYAGVFFAVCVTLLISSLLMMIGSRYLETFTLTILWSLTLGSVCLFCFTMLILSCTPRLARYVTKFDQTPNELAFYADQPSLKTPNTWYNSTHPTVNRSALTYPRKRENHGHWFATHVTLLICLLACTVFFQLAAIVSWCFVVCAHPMNSVIADIEFEGVKQLQLPGRRSLRSLDVKSLQNQPQLNEFREGVV